MIRVLVVDDHRLVRAGLITLLEAAGDIEVAGEAADGRQALEAARAVAPAPQPAELAAEAAEAALASDNAAGAERQLAGRLRAAFGDASFLGDGLLGS